MSTACACTHTTATIQANIFRAHEDLIEVISKLSWKQTFERSCAVCGWQKLFVPAAVINDDTTGCMFYRQPFEVLHRAVKVNTGPKLLMFLANCSLMCAGNRVMSRSVPHSMLVFYWSSERDDGTECSASFKHDFMFLIHLHELMQTFLS